jgi:hypothetical protein
VTGTTEEDESPPVAEQRDRKRQQAHGDLQEPSIEPPHFATDRASMECPDIRPV